MIKNTLISIITPTYNSSRFVLETYESILSQSLDCWEWVVTDDFSRDDTWEILLSISEKDSRVKIYRNPINSGAAVARNNSLANAKGNFIAFLDSDDLWEKDKLELQVKFMIEKNIDFTFTSFTIISEDGEHTNKNIDLNTGSLSVGYNDMLLKKATLGCSTVMLKRHSFDKIEMPLLRTGQDYALWLKLLKNGKNAYLLDRSLTKYRIVNGSISRNKFKKALRQWQIYREVEQINFLKSSWYFVNYAWRAIIR
ncbi:glycosyltransferase family 2 protein [Serratia fonticola]